MGYLYHTTESTEKTKERKETHLMALEVIDKIKEEFADDVNLEITGWNETEMVVSAKTESQDEMERIINNALDGKGSLELVSNHKDNNIFCATLYMVHNDK